MVFMGCRSKIACSSLGRLLAVLVGLGVACAPPAPTTPDASEPTVDAGWPDAGGADASVEDAGLPDAGPADAGDDAGVDAGLVDAGPQPEFPELVVEGATFPLGVSSGDVEPTSAVLWTRYTGAGPLKVRTWRVVQGAAYPFAEDTVNVEDGGYVHFDATGLTPGDKYRYAFFETAADGGVQRSAVGRFRAAPARGQKEFITLGATSCMEQGHTPKTLARAGERGDIDAFLLLGDTSYNDDPPPAAKTIEQFRGKWSANLGQDEFKTLFSATSLLATWDDHEVENDWNPETINPLVVAAARQSFFENLPLRRNGTDPNRIYKSVRWGDTVEIFVLDCRSERKPSTRFNGKPNQYLSPEQMEWLKTGLKSSTAVFKVIMNSVPITNFGVLAITGDTWMSYPQQRTELLKWIDDEHIPGVIWVAGDHHFASAGRVAASGAGSTQLEVLAGPGAVGDVNPLWSTFGKPQWDFTSGTANFLLLQLDPDTATVRVSFHDEAGNEFMSREYNP